MKKIDAVITWVDGNDPRHRSKRLMFGGNGDIFKSDDCAGVSRFDNMGEIYWCVASINKFAPWINKIYIVTDEQNPGLDGFLAKYFPDGYIPVEIIDHKTIFKGYEKYLPTFNSISLETITWRIPGLSDFFIEFNDDLLLLDNVVPSDFFTDDGKVVCYARKYSLLWAWITRKLKRRINGRKPVTFKGVMVNAAKLAGLKRYFLKLDHTPKALSRIFYEKYFSQNPHLFEKNISCRFRDAEQFTPQELQYATLYKNNQCELRPVKGNLFFLQPKEKKGYIQRKLNKLENMKKCKFACFNSLNLASTEDKELIIETIMRRLGL